MIALEALPTEARGARLHIKEAERLSGVPAKTIRFYEAEGVVPAPVRSASGYRQYSEADVRRLRLVRRLRGLGLGLDAVRRVADSAFAAECRDYVRDVAEVLDGQCAEIDRQVAELVALRTDLRALADEARAAAPHVRAGRRVESCGECPVVDGPEPVERMPAPLASSLVTKRGTKN